MTTSERVWLALGATLAACIALMVLLFPAAMYFLRDRMRLGCWSEGCADGSSYLGPILLLGMWTGILLLATALVVALEFRRPLAAARTLAIIAVSGLGFVIVVSFIAAAISRGYEITPNDTWPSVMAAPSLLFGLATVALVVAVVARRRPLIRAALCVGLLPLLAATVLEPTLGFGTAPVLIALGMAIWLAGRPDDPPEPQPLAAGHSRSSIA